MINKETYSKHECFGYLATFLGFAGIIPQLYKTYKTRDAKIKNTSESNTN